MSGHNILEFQIDERLPFAQGACALHEPVDDYYSPIGNSSVAYPYITTKNSIYLILERVKIKRDPKVEDDPYTYFYKLKPASIKFSTKTLFDAWKKK
jgi:hypothetical protein